jgi:hypothetical protein
MSGRYVDMEAYAAALAARECPYHRPAQEYEALGGLATAEAQRVVGDYKPETYGPLSLAIETMVERMLADPSTHPVIADTDRARVLDSYSRQAEADIPFMGWLYRWKDVTASFAGQTAATIQGKDREALESLLKIRGAINAPGTIEEALLTGGDTAIVTSGLLANSMNKQLTAMGCPRDSRVQILRRSYKPLLDCTTMYFDQLDSMAEANLGRANAFLGLIPTIDLTKARTDLFTLSETNRLDFTVPPEDMPGRDTARAGDAPLRSNEALISCPIRFTPQLAQRLWVAFIDNMAANNLV